MMTEIVLWSALALIFYAYLGFPLLLLVRGLVLRRPVQRKPITPSVSVVIVAHNEVDAIAAKLDNVLALDYPRDRLEVIVASDGSDDGTDTVVAAYGAHGVRLLPCARAGKIPALNAAVRTAGGEILVFSDANSMYRPDALRRLVAPFADPAVGGVGGNQCYTAAGGAHLAGIGERAYWSFDRALKQMQSRAGSMTSATGAIHAVRRSLFRPVPLGVGDDFVISAGVVTEGYRLVFEPEAVAYESVAPTGQAEFRRKVRVIVRGLRGLLAVKGLFNPLRHGFYAVQITSHKLLRWSVCWLLIVLAAASLATVRDGPVYAALAAGQGLFYLAAGIGWALKSTLGRSRLLKVLAIPFYFCLANYAALRAWLEVLGGRRIDVWESKRSARVQA